MPSTTIEQWLGLNRLQEPLHRCRSIIREWQDEDGVHVTCCTDGHLQTHHIVAMSSLSRRACYKCGNVGHYAEVCSSAERLCYNCECHCAKCTLWYILTYIRQATWYANYCAHSDLPTAILNISQVMNRTAAHFLGRPMQSNAIIVKVSDMFKQIAPPCA